MPPRATDGDGERMAALGARPPRSAHLGVSGWRTPLGLTGRVDVARAERLRLCVLFDELGPEAPTVLDGWRTAELAAHLLARETRPDAVPGMTLALTHPWTERVERGIRDRLAYREVVARLRQGPPLLSIGRLAGWRADVAEWFVHHEDVRRANGLAPRPDSEDQRRLDDAIWSVLPFFAPLLAHPVHATVILVSEDGRRRRARRGLGAVEVHGRPSELLLALFGRPGAVVQAIGDPEAVRRWQAR